MKRRIFLLVLSMLAVGLAEEDVAKPQPKNPEVEKIDARLDELKTIWKQDTAIINQLTNFKRTPVQEGTQAYYKCLESSRRIQAAEAEAKSLKVKKQGILSHGQSGSDQTQSSFNGVFDGNLNTREFDPIAIIKKSAEFKKKAVVFKGFYLGMPASDAQGLLNHYCGFKQASDRVLIEGKDRIMDATRNSLAEYEKALVSPYLIVKPENREWNVVAQPWNINNPFAVLDDHNRVVEFFVSTTIRDKLFESNGWPLDEFIGTFSDAYKIEIPLAAAFPDIVDGQACYLHRDPRGFELRVWGDGMKTSNASPGSFWLKSIGTEEERKSKFD